MDNNDEGFTLIELLVVVIIIGVLAAIAIPGFLGQREKAHRAAVVADARAAVLTVETYATGATLYPADQTSFDVAMAGLGGGSPGVHLSYTPAADGNSYVLSACHDALDATGSCTDGSATAVISFDSAARLME